jgi:hypothetical protein
MASQEDREFAAYSFVVFFISAIFAIIIFAIRNHVVLEMDRYKNLDPKDKFNLPTILKGFGIAFVVTAVFSFMLGFAAAS